MKVLMHVRKILMNTYQKIEYIGEMSERIDLIVEEGHFYLEIAPYNKPLFIADGNDIIEAIDDAAYKLDQLWI